MGIFLVKHPYGRRRRETPAGLEMTRKSFFFSSMIYLPGHSWRGPETFGFWCRHNWCWKSCYLNKSDKSSLRFLSMIFFFNFSIK